MATHLNVEIKARCAHPQRVVRRLRELGAHEQGLDRQVDTYFVCAAGRLKLRQGPIENHLIHYARADRPGPKDSHVTLHPVDPPAGDGLRDLLTTALGVRVTVVKSRTILWIGEVKFHVDDVDGLGTFVEIEAIDRAGDIGRPRLLELCERYLHELGIAQEDLEPRSYSDLLLAVTS